MTTADRVILPSEPNQLGWVALTTGNGEGYTGELPDRAAKSIATLIHTSDWHICDAESPARQEYLDRYFDPDSKHRAELGFIGTYRAQEAFTLQVGKAWIDAINNITVGPALGNQVDAVVITGDVSDNAQSNELDWYLTLLDGGEIDPSGGRANSEWVGANETVTWDERYWHPSGNVAGGELDIPSRTYGFPTIPSLIESARKKFKTAGLSHNWFSIHGNHDALLQGTVVADETLRDLAIGNTRIIELPKHASPLFIAEAIAPSGIARYIHDDSFPTELVTPDARREIVRAGDFAKLHLGSTSKPNGHGFSQSNVTKNTAYFTAELGDLTLISLDTVNQNGGWQGSLDREQFMWLREQLTVSKDKYVLLASHHPLHCLINDNKSVGEEARVLADELLSLILSFDHVIAWLTGHEHRNAVHKHELNEKTLIEINSPSLIDWPQQGRILEISKEPNGTIAIVSTVIDHDGEVAPDYDRLNLTDIAGISRELAVNDYQRRDPQTSIQRLRGEREDRNFVIRIPDPFFQV